MSLPGTDDRAHSLRVAHTLRDTEDLAVFFHPPNSEGIVLKSKKVGSVFSKLKVAWVMPSWSVVAKERGLVRGTGPRPQHPGAGWVSAIDPHSPHPALPSQVTQKGPTPLTPQSHTSQKRKALLPVQQVSKRETKGAQHSPKVS